MKNSNQCLVLLWLYLYYQYLCVHWAHFPILVRAASLALRQSCQWSKAEGYGWNWLNLGDSNTLTKIASRPNSAATVWRTPPSRGALDKNPYRNGALCRVETVWTLGIWKNGYYHILMEIVFSLELKHNITSSWCFRCIIYIKITIIASLDDVKKFASPFLSTRYNAP